MKTQSITVKTVRNLGLAMLLSLFASSAYAQNSERTITGVVNSLDGPLFGASIVLKGTTIGVSSNQDGFFTFPQQLDEDSVLVVSYLGYENAEVRIKRNTSFVQPFLEDIPVVILGALRTQVSEAVPIPN